MLRPSWGVSGRLTRRMRSAVEIPRAIADNNAPLADRRIEVRVGINLGDVTPASGSTQTLPSPGFATSHARKRDFPCPAQAHLRGPKLGRRARRQVAVGTGKPERHRYVRADEGVRLSAWGKSRLPRLICF